MGRFPVEGLEGALFLLPQLLAHDGGRAGSGIGSQADDLAQDGDFGVHEPQAVAGLSPPVQGFAVHGGGFQAHGFAGQQGLDGGRGDAEAFAIEGPPAHLGEEILPLALQFFFAAPLGPGGQGGGDARHQTESLAVAPGGGAFGADGPAPALAVRGRFPVAAVIRQHHGRVTTDGQTIAHPQQTVVRRLAADEQGA